MKRVPWKRKPLLLPGFESRSLTTEDQRAQRRQWRRIGSLVFRFGLSIRRRSSGSNFELSVNSVFSVVKPKRIRTRRSRRTAAQLLRLDLAGSWAGLFTIHHACLTPVAQLRVIRVATRPAKTCSPWTIGWLKGGTDLNFHPDSWHQTFRLAPQPTKSLCRGTSSGRTSSKCANTRYHPYCKPEGELRLAGSWAALETRSIVS